ncbi:MAG: hypothetical protein SF052_14285 [Bacteroidia bacterium]|nr:hypothetical protein [Bacteroidia bacterium]
MKFSGSTMAYTMTLTLLIATLLGSILTVNKHYRRVLNARYTQERARENLVSGMAFLLSRRPAGSESHAIGLFEFSPDSFYAETEDWGLLRLVHGKGVYAQSQEFRSCMVGQPLAVSTAALVLTGSNMPLTVAGNTRIMGDAVLPRRDVYAGKVDGRNYTGERTVYGKITSLDEIPFIYSKNIPEQVKNILLNLPDPLEGIMDLMNIEATQPWQGEGLEIRQSQSLRLENVNLSGKCRIISGDQVFISSAARLNNCLIFARKIVIGAGFSGRLQAYATDTLEVGENVRLTYPSLLGVAKTHATPAYLSLGKGTVLEGEVIFDPGYIPVARNPKDYVLIGPEATVYGEVRAAHNLDLRGKVNGRVIAGNLLLRTAGTLYINYLLDATLNLGELSPEFAGAISEPPEVLKIIEWL